MDIITVIVPCYNEQEVLPMFYDKIREVMDGMRAAKPELDYELLFIDDGSRDSTLSVLRGYAAQDERVRFISFSRNFGKEAGIYAGLENSRGDYVVVIDADLQHPPQFIPDMYRYVTEEDYDCATTRRVSRVGESKVRSFFARRFYQIMNKISQTEIVDGAQDFRFMKRKVVDAILSMPEYNRFSKGIFSWVGFKTRYIEYENVERAAGTTAWSFWKLFVYSFEGIFAFSTAPLALSLLLGGILGAVGLIMLIVFGVIKLVSGDSASAFAIITALIMLFSGMQLFCIGILGQYISKTYTESKHRPLYLVRETEKDIRKS